LVEELLNPEEGLSSMDLHS